MIHLNVLAAVHRFSGAESRRLGILRTNVDAAEDAVRLLDENSTEAEITAAYTDLADAERDLYATQIGFIQSATGITEEARQDAFTLAEGVFGRELFDANQKLVRALGDVGLQLVAMFDATTGILRGTALATQQIPVEAEEAAADETEAAADETDPVAILRSNARLAANQVRRSRTGLGQATSESDFETRRVGLIQSVNAAYTAQITLLDALGLSAADYQDRFEDAEDTRDAALTRATSSVNTFAEARIKGEEDVAEAAQDAADEAIDAAARTERERVRIAERAARESQRIAERQQRDIQGLRDDALEAERDRADALVELEEDTQERILDIQRKANQSREDVELEFQRDTQDRIRDYTLAFGEILDDTSLSGSERQDSIAELQRENSELARTQGFDRLRDLEDVGIREGRGIQGEGIRETREQDDIAEGFSEELMRIQQETALLESSTALTAAQTIAIQSETAETQATTAAMEAVTAITAAETTTAQTELAGMEAETAAVYVPAVAMFGTGAAMLQTAATLLTEFDLATLVFAVEQIPFALGSLTETLIELPEQLGIVFTETFSQVPGLFEEFLLPQPIASLQTDVAPMEFSALQEMPALSGSALSGAVAGASPSEAGAIRCKGYQHL